MYFVGQASDGPRLLADLLVACDAEVHDFTDPAGLPEIVSLMERYANVPMDFADATLVFLSESLGAADLLTLDRRGFSTFRTRKKESWRRRSGPQNGAPRSSSKTTAASVSLTRVVDQPDSATGGPSFVMDASAAARAVHHPSG